MAFPQAHAKTAKNGFLVAMIQTVARNGLNTLSPRKLYTKDVKSIISKRLMRKPAWRGMVRNLRAKKTDDWRDDLSQM